MDIHSLTQEIAADLTLAESAHRDAAAGIPATNAAVLSGAEQSAVAAAQSAGRKQISVLESHCQQTEAEIPVCQKILREAKRQRISADDGTPPESDLLSGARATRDNSIAAYNQFKRENRLIRDAHGDDRLAQFAWAVAVIVLEGAINSLLFRHAFSGGIAEGFIVAFFISLVNVGFAFVGGALCLRYAINHCNPAIKLSGLGGLLLFLSVCALTVALSAWFRGHVEVLLDSDLPAAELASQAWTNSLLSLQVGDYWGLISSLNAFLLVFVGILCAMCGVWKGYELDDPYPGFGNMLRQKENAEEQYREMCEVHDVRMRKWREDCGGGMRRAENELRKATDVLRAAMRGMRHAQLACADLPVTVAQLAGALLSVYRSQNSEIRRAEPPPYFFNYPAEQEFVSLSSASEYGREQSQQLAAAAAELLEECEKERRLLWQAIERTNG